MQKFFDTFRRKPSSSSNNPIHHHPNQQQQQQQQQHQLLPGHLTPSHPPLSPTPSSTSSGNLDPPSSPSPDHLVVGSRGWRHHGREDRGATGEREVKEGRFRFKGAHKEKFRSVDSADRKSSPRHPILGSPSCSSLSDFPPSPTSNSPPIPSTPSEKDPSHSHSNPHPSSSSSHQLHGIQQPSHYQRLLHPSGQQQMLLSPCPSTSSSSYYDTVSGSKITPSHSHSPLQPSSPKYNLSSPPSPCKESMSGSSMCPQSPTSPKKGIFSYGSKHSSSKDHNAGKSSISQGTASSSSVTANTMTDSNLMQLCTIGGYNMNQSLTGRCPSTEDVRSNTSGDEESDECKRKVSFSKDTTFTGPDNLMHRYYMGSTMYGILGFPEETDGYPVLLENPSGCDLDVPSTSSSKSNRSKSFDATAQGHMDMHATPRSGSSHSISHGGRRIRPSGGLLEIPKWRMFIRRSSAGPTAPSSLNETPFWRDCVHCVLLEEVNSAKNSSPPPSNKGSVSSDGSLESDPDMWGSKRSISCESQDSDVPSGASGSPGEGRRVKNPSPIPLVTLSMAPEKEEYIEEDLGNGVTVISLEVPVLPKSGRSASMDSSYLQVPKRGDIMDLELPPGKCNRSRSVDIALPVGMNGPYIVVPSERPIQVTTQKAIHGEIKISTENGETRTLRCAPDWGETAINGDHLWVPTNNTDPCYVGENECSKQGPRLRCPVCKITAHTGCIGILIDKIKFHCRPTFKDVGVRQYREHTVIPHHWVHRRSGPKGKCDQCSKPLQSKLSFGNKEIVALSCSWCKSTYHNKDNCFTMDRMTDMCKLGPLGDLIIPPSWIVKLPRKGSFKSSIRRSPRVKRSSSKRRFNKKTDSEGSASPSSSISTVTVAPGTALLHSLTGPSPLSIERVQESSSSVGDIPTETEVTSSELSVRQSFLGGDQDRDESSSSPPPISTNLNQFSPIKSSSGLALNHNNNNNNTICPSPITTTPSPTPTTTNTPPRMLHPSSSPALAPTTTTSSSSLLPITTLLGQHKSFAIKPLPFSTNTPLLVFINPKSGGNQGGKLIQKFQWHLNPRQVFDLNQGGPRLGLELYKHVQNLRILACGGDGTAGWIFSALDDLGISPAVAVLPLGTGNDLARAFGWGGGYTDEPVSKILLSIRDGELLQLDRWNLFVDRNRNYMPEPSPSFADDLCPPTSISPSSSSLGIDHRAKDNLPMNIMNNYFSIGVDAHIALEFHEAREAHPERFNSRLRNKMFYGQAGGKDLLQRKWKDLCNYIRLECDGVDMTQKLRDYKIHSLLFLNISSYGGGTRPWAGSSPVYETPKTDDGLIEVIGLTTYQLPLLQAGGHGSCIAQCRSAKITTTRTIPMQVDGEPCRLLPSIIRLELRNKANVIQKSKTGTTVSQGIMPKTTLALRKLNLADYEMYHYDKDHLKETSIHLGDLTIDRNMYLDRARSHINVLLNSRPPSSPVTPIRSIPPLSVPSPISPGIPSGTCGSPSSDSPQVPMSPSSPSTSHLPTFDSRLNVDFSDSDYKQVTCLPTFSTEWWFVDGCTAERFFRIDLSCEHLHIISDICNEDLYIMEAGAEEKDQLDQTCKMGETGILTASFKPGDDKGFLLGESHSTLFEDSEPQDSFLSSGSHPESGPLISPFCRKSPRPPASLEPSVQDQESDSFLKCKSSSSIGSPSPSPTYSIPSSPNSFSGIKGLNPTDHDSSLSPLPTPSRSRESPSSSSPYQPRVLDPTLVNAVLSGNVAAVTRLADTGMSLQGLDEDNGMSILHYAARSGEEDMVQMLIGKSMGLLDIQDSGGKTPLHTAVQHHHPNICTMLTVAGCSLEMKDQKGFTPKQLALKQGDDTLAEYLDNFEQTHGSSHPDRESTI